MTTFRKTTCRKYEPGVSIDVTGGATMKEFEDPDIYAKAVVVEDGLLKNPDCLLKAITYFNLTGESIYVALCDPAKYDKSLPRSRQNTKGKVSFRLPCGESSHTAVPPFCYNLCIRRKGNNDQHKVQPYSLLSLPLHTLRNQIITVSNGRELGDVKVKVTTSLDNNYTIVNNLSDERISVSFTKSNLAYKRSQSEIRADKLDRRPDMGGNKEDGHELRSGAKWNYFHQLPSYIVHLVDDPQAEQPSDIDNLGEIEYPPTTDYVENDDYVEATAGDVVVFFRGSTQNGELQSKVYDVEEIKLVSGTIATNVASSY